jgi:eukaryotic-like serine/threonine-protein kinase
MDQSQFVSLLVNSRLLISDQAAKLEELRRHYPEAATLAAILVQQKWITKWQAQMLLSGHSAFFVGRYRLMRLIGQGGMGAVFEASSSRYPAPVAVKMMNADLTKKPGAVERFKREIEAARALGDHPNIVRACDDGAVNNVQYLVMEFVEGRPAIGNRIKRSDSRGMELRADPPSSVGIAARSFSINGAPRHQTGKPAFDIE